MPVPVMLYIGMAILCIDVLTIGIMPMYSIVLMCRRHKDQCTDVH